MFAAMTIKQIREVATATPFQPFVVETAGGRQFEVPHPDYFLFGPANSQTVVIFDPEGTANLTNAEHIVSLAIQAPA